MYGENTKQKRIIFILIILVIILLGYILYAHFSKSTQVENTQAPEVVAPVVQTPTNQNPTPSTSNTTNTPPKVITPKDPPLPIGTDQFVVSITTTSETISQNLFDKEYITDVEAFTKSIGTKPITPGAYKISKVMTPGELLKVLRGKPYMKWVLIPPGLRKEEIAELLKTNLGWTTKQKTDWITKDTTKNGDYIEGVYFPDTYLIPIAETPADVATRLIAKFNEKFAPYLPQFTTKNIKWTTGLTLASIVQREAANVADMPLIAGILWNRLNQNMMLDVDATLQYVRGNTGSGWWAPITVTQKKIDSPYNTYMHTGLPPHPIANPSIEAIAAVLAPAQTDCLYYLHDKNRVTHCAVTYEEHQANIKTYLQGLAN